LFRNEPYGENVEGLSLCGDYGLTLSIILGGTSINRPIWVQRLAGKYLGAAIDRRCRFVGVRWKPAILLATTSGIETSSRNYDFIQETGWIMCGFGIDGGHVVGIFESG
jgi:hypothetical protein